MLNDFDGHLPIVVVEIEPYIDGSEGALTNLAVRNLILANSFGLHRARPNYIINSSDQKIIPSTPSIVLAEQVDLLETLEVVDTVWSHCLVVVDQQTVQVAITVEPVGTLSSLLHEVVRQDLGHLNARLGSVCIHSPFKRVLFGVELSAIKWVFLGLLR